MVMPFGFPVECHRWVFELKQSVTVEQVNAAFKAAADGPLVESWGLRGAPVGVV